MSSLLSLTSSVSSPVNKTVSAATTPAAASAAAAAAASPTRHASSCHTAARVRDVLDLGLSRVVCDEGRTALLRCTMACDQLPPPEFAAHLVAVTYGAYSWGSKEEQNAWLVGAIEQRVANAVELVQHPKAMHLVHELLVHGDVAFAQAISERARKLAADRGANPAHHSTPLMFDLEELRKRFEGRSLPLGVFYFYTSYLNALVEFEVRFAHLGKRFLDEREDNVWPTTGPLHNEFCDVMQGCVELLKFIIAFDAEFGECCANALAANICSCHIKVETMRRIINDAKRLHGLLSQVMARALRIKAAVMDDYDIASLRVWHSFVANYARIHDRLAAFFERLAATNVDFFTLIPKLKPLPTDIAAKVKQAIDHSELKRSATDLRSVLGEAAAAEAKKTDTGASSNGGTMSASSAPGESATLLTADASVEEVRVAGGGASVDPLRTTPAANAAAAAAAPAGGDGCAVGAMLAAADADPKRQPTEPAIVIDDSFSSALSFYSAGNLVNKRKPRFDGSGGDAVAIALRPEEATVIVASSLNEEDALRRFTVLENDVLGRGAYGIVYKAWDAEKGRHIACKQIALRRDDAAGLQELFREYRVLTALQHPHIVQVVGFLAHRGQGRIFMEWVPSGSVQAVLAATKRGLRESVVRRYVREALEGLAYLHGKGIVHRDIKPGNMLLSASGEIKLTDFGTSRALAADAATVNTASVVGTVPYLAPESVRGAYSAASDVWALGCTAQQLYTARVPWLDAGCKDQVSMIFKIGSATEADHMPPLVCDDAAERGVPPSPAFRDFLAATMTLDRYARPTAAKLLEHPWIKGQ